jgi:hypothetical protein
MSSLSDGNHHDPRISLQVVKIFAHAQNSAFAVHMPRKPLGNRSLGQRMKKNPARGISHLTNRRVSVRIAHGEKLD